MLLHLLEQEGLALREMEDLLYHKIGLLGVSGIMGTPAVLAAIAVFVAAQLVFTFAPFLHELFGTTPIALLDGLLILAISVITMAVLECEKAVVRKVWSGSGNGDGRSGLAEALEHFRPIRRCVNSFALRQGAGNQRGRKWNQSAHEAKEELPMMIREMPHKECAATIAAQRLARLVCAENDSPYVAPICYAYSVTRLFAFSMPGKKRDILHANPRDERNKRTVALRTPAGVLTSHHRRALRALRITATSIAS